MTAALLLGTATRPPVAMMADAAGQPAAMLALSSQLVLLAVRDVPALGPDIGRIAEATLSGAAGALRPPLSWQTLAMGEGRLPCC